MGVVEVAGGGRLFQTRRKSPMLFATWSGSSIHGAWPASGISTSRRRASDSAMARGGRRSSHRVIFAPTPSTPVPTPRRAASTRSKVYVVEATYGDDTCGASSISLRIVSVSRSSTKKPGDLDVAERPDSTARRRPTCFSSERTMRVVRQDPRHQSTEDRPGGDPHDHGVESTGAPKIQTARPASRHRSGCAAATAQREVAPERGADHVGHVARAERIEDIHDEGVSERGKRRPGRRGPSGGRGLSPQPGRSTRRQRNPSSQHRQRAQLDPAFENYVDEQHWKVRRRPLGGERWCRCNRVLHAARLVAHRRTPTGCARPADTCLRPQPLRVSACASHLTVRHPAAASLKSKRRRRAPTSAGRYRSQRHGRRRADRPAVPRQAGSAVRPGAAICSNNRDRAAICRSVRDWLARAAGISGGLGRV